MSWNWKKALRNSTPSSPRAAPSRAPGSGTPLPTDSRWGCVFCRGRGTIAGGGVCPVCSGAGTLRIDPPSVACAFCGGQGQMPPRSNLTCWVCGGRGRVAVCPPVETCPDCDGRGRRRCETLPCARCRGIGVIEQRDAPSVAAVVPATLRGPRAQVGSGGPVRRGRPRRNTSARKGKRT